MRLLLLSVAAALSVPGTHKRPIRIAPGLEVTVLEADEGKPGGVHTGTVTWSGARALAAYLSERPELVDGKRVVEVGCGCGLVSLTCCALGAASVLATDVEADALRRVAGAPGSIARVVDGPEIDVRVPEWWPERFLFDEDETS